MDHYINAFLLANGGAVYANDSETLSRLVAYIEAYEPPEQPEPPEPPE